MHKLILLLLVLVYDPLAIGQFTLVSGTIVDPSNLPYVNGTITPTLVIAGSPRFASTGFPYNPPTQPSGLDTKGSFAIQLADVTQLIPAGGTWSFHVCSAGGTVQPGSPITGGPVCFDLTGITISGTMQDISAQLTAVAQPLTRLVAFGTTFLVPTGDTFLSSNAGINLAGAAVNGGYGVLVHLPVTLNFSIATTLQSAGTVAGANVYMALYNIRGNLVSNVKFTTNASGGANDVLTGSIVQGSGFVPAGDYVWVIATDTAAADTIFATAISPGIGTLKNSKFSVGNGGMSGLLSGGLLATHTTFSAWTQYAAGQMSSGAIALMQVF